MFYYLQEIIKHVKHELGVKKAPLFSILDDNGQVLHESTNLSQLPNITNQLLSKE